MFGGIEEVKGVMAPSCCERVGGLLSEVGEELVWRWFAENLLDLHGRHLLSVDVVAGRDTMTTLQQHTQEETKLVMARPAIEGEIVVPTGHGKGSSSRGSLNRTDEFRPAIILTLTPTLNVDHTEHRST